MRFDETDGCDWVKWDINREGKGLRVGVRRWVDNGEMDGTHQGRA